MDNITKMVGKEIEAGWIGSNKDCPYHPCHFEGQDCTFCYCPFYPCNDTDLGHNIVGRNGKDIWSCSECLFIHRTPVAKFVMSEIKRMGITDPKDPRIKDLFPETKERFFKPGKAVMVLGATSDAGKSVIVAAICRMLHERGHLVAPFKSQNMSLNSKVTLDGSEIAMIQTVQAKAAGLRNPDAHMNPILLKPKGDSRSQVIVEGKPFGDYGVPEYYSEFVPGPGVDIVRRNMDFLKKQYDYVVMEGAGSPAEINIYDSDIANMKAAEIADANCILVINVEWGGAYAYALGTIELLEENDRKRIKGIVLNNVRGDKEKMRSGADELERLTGIPVIGIIPHLDIELPTEDSEMFRNIDSKGDGKAEIAVIKLPRIANFTDLDPLYLEDVKVRFVSDAKGLEGCDAIVLPGTKNTIEDMKWMQETGIADAIKAMKGKVPILGICGGYQMMGKTMNDPSGLEGKVPGVTEGLGFFDNDTTWEEYKKRVIQDTAVLIKTGEEVTGYEIHMGLSVVNEDPLFKIQRLNTEEPEGSVREDEMLFGTYLHGCLDKAAFRRYFMSFVKHGGESVEPKEIDYDAYLEDNIRKLAKGFEDNVDIEALMKVIG